MKTFFSWLIVLVCFVPSAHAQLLSPGPLAKAHRELEGDGSCNRCHSSGAQVSEPKCIDCHADIGKQRKSHDGLHGKTFANKTCGPCHVEHLGESVSLIRWPTTDPKRFDHDQTDFDLRGAHTEVRCEKCHDKRNERHAKTFLGLESTCVSCHEDPHKNRFGNQCTACHDEVSFKNLTLEKFDHDLARFPLTGEHTKVECAKCHGTPPQYKDMEFQDCSSCHEDPHEGRYKNPCKTCHQTDSFKHIVMPAKAHPGLSLAGGHQRTECTACHDNGLTQGPSRGSECVACHKPVHEAPFGNRCENCHASIRFLGIPESIGRNAHARTVFPLKGEHASASCEGCHRPELPRPQRYRGLSYDACASCHADVHKGTLSDIGDCALCHDPLGFAPSLVNTSTHQKFSFPLLGNHEATACSGCHEHKATPRVIWERSDHECINCHQNPHGDQFAAEMSQGGCAHCHTPAGFGLTNYDHKTWPLTGAHRTTSCDSCHEPTAADKKAGNGASYRGVPRECEGCHDDEHAGQFQRSEPMRACVDCHDTERFQLPSFDHAKQTSYPLEGKHQEVDCARCHPITQLRNGDQVTRYRLGYKECADCHADPHSPARPK